MRLSKDVAIEAERAVEAGGRENLESRRLFESAVAEAVVQREQLIRTGAGLNREIVFTRNLLERYGSGFTGEEAKKVKDLEKMLTLLEETLVKTIAAIASLSGEGKEGDTALQKEVQNRLQKEADKMWVEDEERKIEKDVYDKVWKEADELVKKIKEQVARVIQQRGVLKDKKGKRGNLYGVYNGLFKTEEANLRLKGNNTDASELKLIRERDLASVKLGLLELLARTSWFKRSARQAIDWLLSDDSEAKRTAYLSAVKEVEAAEKEIEDMIEQSVRSLVPEWQRIVKFAAYEYRRLAKEVVETMGGDKPNIELMMRQSMHSFEESSKPEDFFVDAFRKARRIIPKTSETTSERDFDRIADWFHREGSK